MGARTHARAQRRWPAGGDRRRVDRRTQPEPNRCERRDPARRQDPRRRQRVGGRSGPAASRPPDPADAHRALGRRELEHRAEPEPGPRAEPALGRGRRRSRRRLGRGWHGLRRVRQPADLRPHPALERCVVDAVGDPRPSHVARLRAARCRGRFCQVPAILHWNGQAWQHVAAPSPGDAFSGVCALSPTSVYAVGNAGSRTLVVRWNGSTWTTETTPSPGLLLAAAAAGTGSVWAVGLQVTGSGEYRTLAIRTSDG